MSHEEMGDVISWLGDLLRLNFRYTSCVWKLSSCFAPRNIEQDLNRLPPSNISDGGEQGGHWLIDSPHHTNCLI